MIDIENKVFNDVCVALRTEFLSEYPKLVCYGEYVDVPASFPCITLVEDDNYVYQNAMDTEHIENFVKVMYTVNVYTNNEVGRKGIAKTIANFIDSKMETLGFARTMRSQLPNVDRTIYRITMRYSAIVSSGETSIVTDGDNEETITKYTLYRK